MGMVDSRPRSNSNRTNRDGTGDEREEEAEAPKLVPTYWDNPKAYSYLEANIYTPKSCPPKVSSIACSGEGGPL